MRSASRMLSGTRPQASFRIVCSLFRLPLRLWKRRGNPCRADYPLTMSSPFLYSVQSRPCAFAGAASPTLKTTTDRGAAWRKFLNPSDNSSWFHSHLLPASRIFVEIFELPACRLLPLHLVIQPGSEKCTAVLQESSETSPHLTIPRRTGKCAHFPDFSVRPYL